MAVAAWVDHAKRVKSPQREKQEKWSAAGLQLQESCRTNGSNKWSLLQNAGVLLDTCSLMEFPEDFNQLELLNTHGHLIPRGASSSWNAEEVDEDDDDEEAEHSEEWYLQKEDLLKERPEELMLWAAEYNRVSTIHRLLSADPSLACCHDEDRYTPLHRAAYSGHVAAASALLAAGSVIKSRTVDGWTPLHSACRWGRVSVAALLLRHGAELNAQTNGGLTALHLAASHTSSPPTDSASTLELLLSQRHLKAGLCSSSGETASEVARRSGPYHFLFEMVEDYSSVLPTC